MKSCFAFIISILVLIFSCDVYSQKVSVTLSLEWNAETKIFPGYNAHCCPFLLIKYSNMSSDSIYFPKIASNINGSPLLFSDEPFYHKITSYNEVKNKYNGTKEMYKVIIDMTQTYLRTWEIIEDTLDINQERTLHPLNNILSRMYAIYWEEDSQFVERNTWYFQMQEITENAILNTLSRKQFVFLEPGGEYIDSFNILPFKMVGGIFEFTFRCKKIHDYVEIEPLFIEHEKNLFHPKVKLPDKVGEYKLYSEEFNANSLTIQFVQE